MPGNSVAENVLGTIGTICWTGQIIPQNWKSWREHSTEGLSAYLVLLWAIGAIPLGVYSIVQNLNIPLIIQPQIFGSLCAVSWTQCLYYTHKRSFAFCTCMFGMYCIIGGGFEVAMVFACRHALNVDNNPRPTQFFGILSSVLIALGLLPQYWEIWKRKEVVGISYFFITIDTLGGVFSLLSLVFKPKFDIIAAVTYSLVVVMDSVILIAAATLNPCARRKHAALSLADTPPVSSGDFLPQEESKSDLTNTNKTASATSTSTA